MTLASLGWGTWWTTVALLHWFPEQAPSLKTASLIAGSFGLLGLLAAVFSLRARLAWILVTMVPLLANLGVILVPVVIKTLRIIRAEQAHRIETRAANDADTQHLAGH